MIAQFIKETYEQVGNYEYNQINPYIEAIGLLNTKHGKVKVKRVKTVYTPIETGNGKHANEKRTSYGVLEIPMLVVEYEVVG